MIQWCLVNLESCTTIPQSSFRIFLSSPKKFHNHLQSLHIFTPKPRQLLIYILYLFICPFWIIHINGIIKYVVFCVSFFHLSGFEGWPILIACFSTYFFVVEEYWFCWYIDQLMIIWISICWLLWTMLLKVCVQVLVKTYFYFFSIDTLE